MRLRTTEAGRFPIPASGVRLACRRGRRPAAPARLDAALAGQDDGIQGILVAKNGRIVYERYRDGKSAATKFPVYSVTKSVIGMLVGIAVGSHEQDIGNADQLLGDILTAEVVAGEDQRVQERPCATC